MVWACSSIGDVTFLPDHFAGHLHVQCYNGGLGGGVGIVFPSWSHVTSSLTGNLVFREEQAVNRYVSLSQFFLYHAAATCILFIICIGYIV